MDILGLSPNLIDQIVAKIKKADTQAIVLVGSFARGNPKLDSDVDITHYIKEEGKNFDFFVFEGKKVSIFTTTFQNHRNNFHNPEEAIWVVPYLQIAKVLYDPQGLFIPLQKEALQFQWKDMQLKADCYANSKLEKYLEEVIKIVSGFKENDEYPIFESPRWICSGLAMIIAVQKGIYLDNESTYLKQIQNKVG